MPNEMKEKIEELEKEVADVVDEPVEEEAPKPDPDPVPDTPPAPEKRKLGSRVKEFYGKNKKTIKKWTKRTLVIGGILAGGLLGLDFLAKQSGNSGNPEDTEDLEDDPDTVDFDGEDLDVPET